MLRNLIGGIFKNSGSQNETEFWQNLVGVSQGTAVDNMVYYLGSLGYTGTPGDMLRGWLQSHGTPGNTASDNALAFMNSYTADDYVRNAEETVVTNEDGDIISTGDDVINDSGVTVQNDDEDNVTRE